MNQSDYDTFVRQLSLLTKKQMQDARRRLGFLIGGEGEGQQSDWILDGVFTVLRERGLGHMIPSKFRILKSSSYHGYETQADSVRRCLSEAVPNMTLTETRAMGVLAARALADFMSTWKKSEDGSPYDISLTTMLNNIGRIPDAIDVAFPGYMAADMLGFILRRNTAAKT